MKKTTGRVSVGFLASGFMGLLGYLVGAPIEAVIVFIVAGTAIEQLFFGDSAE